MLKVENVEVLGWEHAIRGMRNPKNSWAKSDSGPECPYGKEKCYGECIDILKKHLYQGHAFDSEHMAKELGDVAWYLAISAEAIGYDLETIFQMNIDKLRARYPNGFDAEHSLHRRANDI